LRAPAARGGDRQVVFPFRAHLGKGKPPNTGIYPLLA
jgi:hypothetical protein